MNMLVLRGNLCACVVKCMDMHSARHSENPADVELFPAGLTSQHEYIKRQKSQKKQGRDSQ